MDYTVRIFKPLGLDGGVVWNDLVRLVFVLVSTSKRGRILYAGQTDICVRCHKYIFVARACPSNFHPFLAFTHHFHWISECLFIRHIFPPVNKRFISPSRVMRWTFNFPHSVMPA